MAGISLKEKYRLLVSAMTPAEQALRVQEVSHFLTETKPPSISNERYLRKTIPMGISLPDGSKSSDQK